MNQPFWIDIENVRQDYFTLEFPEFRLKTPSGIWLFRRVLPEDFVLFWPAGSAEKYVRWRFAVTFWRECGLVARGVSKANTSRQKSLVVDFSVGGRLKRPHSF